MSVSEFLDGAVPEADAPFRGPLTGELTRFLMAYKFGLDEMMTKVNILKEELTLGGAYCPIEHVSSRLKSLDSIVEKARRIDCPPTLDAVREQMFDVAGMRIVCSFISDADTVMDMLTSQPDIDLVRARDYIAEPQANGYKSLNLIVETPVYLSDRVEKVRVEVQIRTVAMDAWASLEHKIHYQSHRAIPPRLARDRCQQPRSPDGWTNRWSGCTPTSPSTSGRSGDRLAGPDRGRGRHVAGHAG